MMLILIRSSVFRASEKYYENTIAWALWLVIFIGVKIYGLIKRLLEIFDLFII
mgnify:CR=1 FL=1